MAPHNVFTVPVETPAQKRLRRVVRRTREDSEAEEEARRRNVFAVTPGAPVNRALFQAGFPLGVAQRAPQPIGAKGWIAATEKAAEEERQRALGRVDPETGRAFPDRPAKEIIQEHFQGELPLPPPLGVSPGFEGGFPGEERGLAAMLQVLKERYIEPAGGVAGTLLSKALPGKPGGTETRFDELRSQGFGPFEAARRAMQEIPQPPFVRGVAEMLTPEIALPGVGFGGPLARGTTKLVTKGAPVVTRVVKEAPLAPARLLTGIPEGAGAKPARARVRRAAPKPAAGQTVDQIQAVIDNKIDELMAQGKTFQEADNAPEVVALYEQRFAIERGQLRNLVSTIKSRLKGIDDKKADTLLRDVYSISDDPTGMYFGAQYARDNFTEAGAKIAKAKVARSLAEDWAQKNNLDLDGLLGPMSGYGKAQKEALVARFAREAEDFHQAVLDGLGASERPALPAPKPAAEPVAAEPAWAEELRGVGGQLEPDGSIWLYHATTKDKADEILTSGFLRKPMDAPDSYGVYLSSSKSVAEDYGDGTLVRIRVDAKDLSPDDVFPGRRMDFSIPTQKGVYRPIAMEPVPPTTLRAAAGAAPSPAPPAAGQGLPPPAPAAPAALPPGRVRPTAGPVVGPGEVPLRTPPPGGLPSGRVPGGPRAVPTGPEGARVVSQGAEPPRPPIEPSVAPPSGEFPSGRRPGGLANVGPPPPPRDPLAMIDAALDPQKEPFLKRITKGIPDDWYDSNYPLKELERLTGIPARKAAQVVPGSAMKAEEVVRRFYLPAVGDMVNTEYRNIQRFMVLKRIDDIGAINPGSAFPGGLNRMDAVDALTQMEKQLGAERFAKISQAANDLWDLNHNHVLRPLRLEGLISARAFLEMQTSHPHYIPFKRADFVQDLHESFSGRPVASVGSTGIKRLTEAGSVRALDEPLERLLREPFHVQSLIAKNRAAKTIIEALQELEDITGEEMVRWIEPKATFNRASRVTGQPLKMLKKGEHSQVWETVSFFKDGEKYMADIPARFARAAKGLDAEPLGPVVKFIGITNQPLRLGATALNAFFLPRNIIRDAMSAMFRENLFPFGPDHIAGLWAAIRKNSLFTEAANEGALLSGLMENMTGPKMFQRPVLGSITLERPQDALLLPLRLLALPYRGLVGANVIAERATRLGVYRKLGRIEGISPLERSVRTRDSTVDFSKMGHTMRVVNHVIPFSNAAVQGTANMARTIRDHPVRAAAYAALFGGVVAMVRLNNQRFETSRLIPDYEYTRNWVIQVGEGERKDGTKYPLYFKIPKGEIAASLVFPTEAMFSWAQQAGDKSATEMLLDAGIEAAQVVSPVQDVTSVLPAAAQTGVGLATGIDPFSGIPIVSRREENLPPEQQFGTESSTVAIALGRTFGISPRKIDFAIRDYLAGAGETTNWMLGQVLELIGYKRPEAFGEALEPQPEGAELLSRQPGVRTLLGTRATQEERRGWEQFDQAVEATNRAVGRLGDLNRLGVRLGEVGDSIGKLELTPAQRARYQELAGQQALHWVPILLAWKDYQAASDEEKKELLRKVLALVRDQARDQLLPTIVEELEYQSTAGEPTPTPVPAPQRRRVVRRAQVATPTPTPVGAR